MAAAQRHARLIRQRHHVVRVNVLEEKTHEAGAVLFRAEEADVFQCSELRVSVVREFLVMLPNVFATDGVEIIYRAVQTDWAGDVRRASLETMRRFLELRLLIFDA